MSERTMTDTLREQIEALRKPVPEDVDSLQAGSWGAALDQKFVRLEALAHNAAVDDVLALPGWQEPALRDVAGSERDPRPRKAQASEPEREEALIDLIRHADLHDAYSRFGYSQMTTPQKRLLDSIIGAPVPGDPMSKYAAVSPTPAEPQTAHPIAERERFANDLEAHFDKLVELMRRYPVEVEWNGPEYFRYVFDHADEVRQAIAELRVERPRETPDASPAQEGSMPIASISDIPEAEQISDLIKRLREAADWHEASANDYRTNSGEKSFMVEIHVRDCYLLRAAAGRLLQFYRPAAPAPGDGDTAPPREFSVLQSTYEDALVGYYKWQYDRSDVEVTKTQVRAADDAVCNYVASLASTVEAQAAALAAIVERYHKAGGPVGVYCDMYQIARRALAAVSTDEGGTA